jgi:acetolactate synthase-1/2/3 large subunit
MPMQELERPLGPLAKAQAFGSDVVAETLRLLDIPFIALNPGASFRGLHDSLVNYLGNREPRMLLCLHEEHAVAIAHGYAKVTGKAMAVAVHSNVGLFHATMAIFNAWCDRMPMLVLGATGPVDAARRRPWIDWLHTARDQGAIVRSYVKWDDQPASPAAAQESLLRGAWIAEIAPKGPVYINLDAGMQEEALASPLPGIDPRRFRPIGAATASRQALTEAAQRLAAAKRPVILAGRVSRGIGDWERRIALAERLQARVITDLRVGAAFPTDHPLHCGAPGIYLVPQAVEKLSQADVILSLDWLDLAGTLRAALGTVAPASTIIHTSLDHTMANGWSMDHQAHPAVDLLLPADPDCVVAGLLAELGSGRGTLQSLHREDTGEAGLDIRGESDVGAIQVNDLAHALRLAVGERAVCLTHLPLSWDGASWPFRHTLDYIGSDGGAGIGAGPGLTVGAALALQGSGRMPIAVCGDGDFLMGATALWTAVHYRIPLLIAVANNRSFFNDEVHQERVARQRGRPIENKWIGQRITDPDIDIAGLARAQGAEALGPVTTMEDLTRDLAAAVQAVEAGKVAVIDVQVEPGYTPAMTASVTRTQS